MQKEDEDRQAANYKNKKNNDYLKSVKSLQFTGRTRNDDRNDGYEAFEKIARSLIREKGEEKKRTTKKKKQRNGKFLSLTNSKGTQAASKLFSGHLEPLYYLLLIFINCEK
jgi:hypothetical protein